MVYKAALLSLGCKVNSYETESIREEMIKSGFEIVEFSSNADVYVINTCSVTNIADRKSRQMLHRARKLNPDAVIVATGCYVQTGKEDSLLQDICDIVVGNNHKGKIPEIVLKFLKDREEKNSFVNNSENVSLIDDIGCEKEVEDISIGDYPERVRAFVRIEDGCNQFCSYCIIPYARGRVRSREKEDILKEIRNLAGKGFKEVVLTGIHISSYGTDNYERSVKQNEWDGAPMLELVEAIDEVPGIERIRLGSLEPRIISKEFLERLRSVRSFCPHFHLSLQSGSDTVLKRMNRHYTAAEFLDKCRLIREVFSDPAITTDVITGFPGETEKEADETLEMVRKASFSKMHIFKYSRRKGTVADRMPDQLTEKEKHERSLKLQSSDDHMHRQYASLFLGKRVKVLVEEEKDGYMRGLTERYLEVKIPVSGMAGDLQEKSLLSRVNSIINAQINSITDDGELIGCEIYDHE